MLGLGYGKVICVRSETLAGNKVANVEMLCFVMFCWCELSYAKLCEAEPTEAESS